jgi:hypothetical protein
MASSSRLTLESLSLLYMELGNRIYEDAIKVYLKAGMRVSTMAAG